VSIGLSSASTSGTLRDEPPDNDGSRRQAFELRGRSGNRGGSPNGGHQSSRWRLTPSGEWSFSSTAGFPALAGRQIDESIAVAIDGEIFQDAHLTQLKPESEIYLILNTRRRLIFAITPPGTRPCAGRRRG